MPREQTRNWICILLF